MSDTPRTDAIRAQFTCPSDAHAPIEDFEQLEQELAAAIKERDEALLKLVAIGEIAVTDWDDATVGKVDAIVPFEEHAKYKDRLRELFITIPEKLKETKEQLDAAMKCVEALRNVMPSPPYSLQTELSWAYAHNAIAEFDKLKGQTE